MIRQIIRKGLVVTMLSLIASSLIQNSSVVLLTVLQKVGKLVGFTSFSFAASLEVAGRPIHVSLRYPVEYGGGQIGRISYNSGDRCRMRSGAHCLILRG
jgi:hypothetical protein